MNQPANLRAGRRVVALIVAGWIAATFWTPSVASAAPGDFQSWTVLDVFYPWGVGYTGKVWISDAPEADKNHEYTTQPPTTEGARLRTWPAGWVGTFIADMVYLPGRKLMCQVNVKQTRPIVRGDNGIHCWDPLTGLEVDSIVGTFPWTIKSQRGLAYRADDDTFYIGGWNEGIVYRIKGLSYPDKGAVKGQCLTPPDPTAHQDPNNPSPFFFISGLAYNAVNNVLWVATNSLADTIYALNPDDCTITKMYGLNEGKLPHPDPGNNGAGLEMNENGNLWMVSQQSQKVFLVESGLSAASTPSVAAITAAVDAMGGAAFRNHGLQQAFTARVRDIQQSLDAGDTVSALQMLRDLRLRFDGCAKAEPAKAEQNDWMAECTKQSSVRTQIDYLIKKLGG